jgi:hypothetical protein
VADAAPGRLLSHYRVSRDPNGHLVLLMPWPVGSVLGCVVPAAAVSLIGGLLALIGRSPVAYAIPIFALVFAAIVIVVLVYQGSHAWVLSPGRIKRGATFGDGYWARSRWSPARSVVVRRVMWSSGRGSTDRVFVVVDRNRRSSVLTVFNWNGSESRLATGGRRSLARTGPLVPDAPRPMATAANETLMSATSPAVGEMADLLITELGVSLSFECEVAPPPPPRAGGQRWI